MIIMKRGKDFGKRIRLRDIDNERQWIEVHKKTFGYTFFSD